MMEVRLVQLGRYDKEDDLNEMQYDRNTLSICNIEKAGVMNCEREYHLRDGRADMEASK